MEYTGEREVPKIPGTTQGIDIKHIQRYQWAKSYTKGKLVYDISSGAGYGSLLLKSKNYVGFDISREAVEYANKYYGRKDVSFHLADACNMPNDLAPVDIIVSFETIEHLEKPEQFLIWCRNHSKMLVISSPIRGSFGKSRFHLFEYSLDKFNRVLKKYFDDVTMFIQKKDLGIIFPCQPEDKGVAVAVCQ